MGNSTIRAARCLAYGPPESVVVESIPAPTAGPGEAVVQVHAAAVNFPDVLVLANAYQVSTPVPFTVGSELAGEVIAVGDGVTDIRPGDRVFGTAPGAFAEQAAVQASDLTVVPDGLDMTLAAAFGVTYITAVHALGSVGQMQPGDHVVVLGAGGGVGLATVDLAAALGGVVLAAASSAEKLDACRAKGATHLVNYATEDLKVRIKDLTGGAHVVVDPVGGPYAEQALRSTRWGGRFVVVGFASGEIPKIPLNLVLLKGVVIKGFEVRTYAGHAPQAAAEDRALVLSLLREGRIRPHVSATFPLTETAAALRLVADRQATGKVVVELMA